MQKYEWKKTLIKGLKVFVIFILPWLVDQFIVSMPAIANLTIGGALYMLVDFLRHKVGVNI